MKKIHWSSSPFYRYSSFDVSRLSILTLWELLEKTAHSVRHSVQTLQCKGNDCGSAILALRSIVSPFLHSMYFGAFIRSARLPSHSAFSIIWGCFRDSEIVSTRLLRTLPGRRPERTERGCVTHATRLSSVIRQVWSFLAATSLLTKNNHHTS